MNATTTPTSVGAVEALAVTPRGKGTGNYGQGIPMPGGLVVATELVTAAGGRLEDVWEGPQASLELSFLSCNHPIERLQKSGPATARLTFAMPCSSCPQVPCVGAG